MNALEIISLIFAISVVIKLVIFLINPKWMLKAVDLVGKQNKLVLGFTVLSTLVLGYFVLTSLTIIQVIPAIFLGMCLMGIILFQYPKLYVKLAKDVLKERNKFWWQWLIWLGLSGWIVYTLFF